LATAHAVESLNTPFEAAAPLEVEGSSTVLVVDVASALLHAAVSTTERTAELRLGPVEDTDLPPGGGSTTASAVERLHTPFEAAAPLAVEGSSTALVVNLRRASPEAVEPLTTAIPARRSPCCSVDL
jgi:hypothetical protein